MWALPSRCSRLPRPFTLQEVVGVEDLDHSVPLQPAGPRAAGRVAAAPEDAAQTQTFDEDARGTGLQQHATLQVPEELLGEVALPLGLDAVDGGEANILQATGTQGWLLQIGGDAPALRVAAQCPARHLPPIEEGDGDC